MNFIFKIIEDDKINEKITVKYCKQSSSKSIDEYPPIVVDYKNLDFYSHETLLHSIFKNGYDYVLDEDKNDPTKKGNEDSYVSKKTTHLDDIIKKVISMDIRKIQKPLRKTFTFVDIEEDLNETNIN